MSDKTTSKKVTLDHRFPAAGRVRAGISFIRGESKTLELTKDQLEAFKNDPYFTISKATAEGSSEGGNAGEGDSTPPASTDDTESNAGTTGETPSTTTVGQAESNSDADTKAGEDPTAGVGDGPVPEDEQTPEEKAQREEALDAAENDTPAPNDPAVGNEQPAENTAPDATPPAEPVTVDGLLKANSRDALVNMATKDEVQGLDYADAANVTKRVIAEAIVAKRQG